MRLDSIQEKAGQYRLSRTNSIMSKANRTNAPTHGWLISNKILRWFAWAFIVIFIISFLAIWTITYSIRRDCNDIYKRDLRIGGYWLDIKMGSTKEGCPDE